MEQRSCYITLLVCCSAFASVAHSMVARRHDGRKTCDVGGVSYKPMERVDMGNPCEQCFCSEETLVPQCVEVKCQIAPCVDSVRFPGMCCPVCMSGPNCLLDDGSKLRAGKNSIIPEENGNCHQICRCPPGQNYNRNGPTFADCYQQCGLPSDLNDFEEGIGNSNNWHP